MNSTDHSQEIVKAWGESAEYWEKHRETIRGMFAPVTNAMIAAAAVSAGHSVLDVAGGAGEPSLSIAPIVGPSGSVTYTDAAEEMVGVAQRAAEKLSIRNIRFFHAKAESLPFEDSRFDAVVCRFGAMFFADPTAACRKMLQAAKPGAPLVFTVWRAPEYNPFFRIVSEVMDRYIEPAPEEPDAPGAFRYAAPGRFAEVLGRAGAADVTEEVLQFRVEGPLGVDDYWRMRTEMSDTLRAKIRRLSREQLAHVEREVKQRARAFFKSGTMSFPTEAISIKGFKK
jgi:SAM-dependent methyltransferase